MVFKPDSFWYSIWKDFRMVFALAEFLYYPFVAAFGVDDDFLIYIDMGA